MKSPPLKPSLAFKTGLFCAATSLFWSVTTIAKEVSISQLIAVGAEFDGIVVEVKGYLDGRDGRPRLYLTKEHAEIRDATSSLLLESANEEFDRQSGNYILASGIFRISDKAGRLHEPKVIRVIRTPPWYCSFLPNLVFCETR